jgi:hypothetical protein
MKMDHVGLRLLKDSKETPNGVKEVNANVGLHNEALCSHLLAKGAKGRHSVNARIVSLFSLQTTHLRHERFCSAHFHTVDYVRYLHNPCLISIVLLNDSGVCLSRAFYR